MKIATKYSVGDTVFKLTADGIVSKKIKTVFFKSDNDAGNFVNSVSYILEGNSMSDEEEKLFDSKQALIKTL